MNVLICPDKFKGTLTAIEVCSAIREGLSRSIPDISVTEFPLADGGDGTLDIFLWHLQGKVIEHTVHDPLFRKIKASYGISKDGKVAYIEMAKASGLNLLKPGEYNAKRATTLGTGELIRHAIEHGAEKIVLGIGGSATNDAGIGAAVALGYEFLDEVGNSLRPIGENLIRIHKINNDNVYHDLKNASITAMCDVTNPFYGREGAAFTYAKQKGASPEDVASLDEGLHHIAGLWKKSFGIDVQQLPGAGAGGGIAGGVHVMLSASLSAATTIIFDITNIAEAIRHADVVITGEGKTDQQTTYGKLVARIGALALDMGKRVIAVSGVNELSTDEARTIGISEIVSLTEFAGSERAISDSANVLEELSEKVLSEKLLHL